MPARSFPLLRRFFAVWEKYRKKPSRSARRAPLHLVLEALEDRLTPSAGVQEQYMLDLINRFRANPSGELSLILNANDPNVNNALAFYNVDRTALAAAFASLTPAPPLAWNDSLATSALGHSQTMLAAQDQDHQVPGELDPWTRMANAGYTNSTFLAENIYAYADAVFDAEAAFVIDWGNNPPTGVQNPAGHRGNLLDPDLREVGIGLVNAPSGSPMGPLLVTQDFGNRTTITNPFVLGNVYSDNNLDGFYEPGEGMSGVTLTFIGGAGTFQTTTTAAGGYQLQVPAGTYQVTASGGGLAGPIVRTYTVGSVNLQADFIKPILPVPTFTAPAASTTNNTPTFSWSAISGAAAYDLWVNDVTTGQQQIIRNQSLNTNTFTSATPLAAGAYQAWIRITTAGGTSAWSATYNFTITAPPPPTMTAPSGSTPLTNQTFTWTTSAGATRYDLWVTDLTTNTSQYIRQQNVPTNSYTPPAALPVGSYVAWVEAYNGTIALGSWSAGLNFTITAPAAPTLTGPAPVITSTTPTFTWTSSTGATQYDVWADNNTTKQSQVVRQTVATTSYTPVTPIPRGQYTVWVRAANSAGVFGPWSAAYNFLIDTTAPAIPAITGPAGSTPLLKPTIAWSNTGAARYDLWVNNLTTGAAQVIRQQNLNTNSFTPAANLTVGSYVVWVEAYDNTNQTRGWSASYNFTITLPAAPTQLSPAGLITTTMPTFSWAAVTGAATYDLWVDNVSANQSQIIRQQSLSTTSYTPLTALAKGNYRFWVRAINGNGNAGAWSAKVDFTIG